MTRPRQTTGDTPSSGVLEIVVPVPLHRRFDYLPPAGVAADEFAPGVRVRVPFGRGTRLGLVVTARAHSALPRSKLRRVTERLDDAPVIDASLLELLTWAADYYRQPPGEMVWQALPAAMRQGAPAATETTAFRATPQGLGTEPGQLSRRAPRQGEMLARLHAGPVAPSGLDEPGRRALRTLVARELAEPCVLQPDPGPTEWPAPAAGPPLAAAQAAAVDAILADGRRFGVHLLFGVTGSGKTEVYLQLIGHEVRAGRQSMLLVPEIGLTPQLVGRLRERFGDLLAVMHSQLSDGERVAAWRAAREGRAAVIVGTRSALFTPLARPGLIVLDEEHDASYRQQDGVRYSARDLAVMRARSLNLPLVLGSATPSLESLRHALDGRYTLQRLPERAGERRPPTLRLVDIDHHARQQGLSTPLLTAMQRHLDADGQVLLFLNRRGFAPALWCESCGHIVECRRCDARMTLHHAEDRLRCHHCGSEATPPPTCPECTSAMVPVGQGTERIEDVLGRLFPDVACARIDRDSVRRRGALEASLAAVHAGTTRILVGTQMLAKGHDFPGVTLVGILDADQGLFSSDFRASERLAQTIIQVAGRAGRGDRPGEVLIQTRFPDHPLLQQLVTDGFEGFARELLREREATGWPPYARLALVRAEAPSRAAPGRLLTALRRAGEEDATRLGVTLLGPAPAAMERRAGRYRQQLLLLADTHGPLQRLLARLLPVLETAPEARRARWSIDVDPADLM